MTSADAIQIHRRCDGAFELLVNANLLFFQRAAGISVRSNLPFRRPGQNRQALNNGTLFDAWHEPSAARSALWTGDAFVPHRDPPRDLRVKPLQWRHAEVATLHARARSRGP